MQKNQSGCEPFVMVRFHCGKDAEDEVLGGMKMFPESNPPAIGMHGLANVDCVTEWLPGTPEKVKRTMSPWLAVTLEGVNTKMGLPVPPTATS